MSEQNMETQEQGQVQDEGLATSTGSVEAPKDSPPTTSTALTLASLAPAGATRRKKESDADYHRRLQMVVDRAEKTGNDIGNRCRLLAGESLAKQMVKDNPKHGAQVPWYRERAAEMGCSDTLVREYIRAGRILLAGAVDIGAVEQRLGERWHKLVTWMVGQHRLLAEGNSGDGPGAPAPRAPRSDAGKRKVLGWVQRLRKVVDDDELLELASLDAETLQGELISLVEQLQGILEVMQGGEVVEGEVVQEEEDGCEEVGSVLG